MSGRAPAPAAGRAWTAGGAALAVLVAALVVAWWARGRERLAAVAGSALLPGQLELRVASARAEAGSTYVNMARAIDLVVGAPGSWSVEHVSSGPGALASEEFFSAVLAPNDRTAPALPMEGVLEEFALLVPATLGHDERLLAGITVRYAPPDGGPVRLFRSEVLGGGLAFREVGPKGAAEPERPGP